MKLSFAEAGTFSAPATWDGTSIDSRLFDALEFQIGAITGTGPWTPQRSLDGANWDACRVMDQSNNFISSLTSAHVGKILSADGRGYFRLYSATGTDTVTGTIRAS